MASSSVLYTAFPTENTPPSLPSTDPVFQDILEKLNSKMEADPEYICRMTETEFAVYKEFIIRNFGIYDNFMADFDYTTFINWAKRVCAPDSDSDDGDADDDNVRMIKNPDAIPPNGRDDPNSDRRRVANRHATTI